MTETQQREARERLDAFGIRGSTADLRLALDALDRVRKLAEQRDNDLPEPLNQVWNNAMAHVRAALDGKLTTKGAEPLDRAEEAAFGEEVLGRLGAGFNRFE